MLALLSRLLRDSSSFCLRAWFCYLVASRSFSSFCLSMLSSLIWLCLSDTSATFCCISSSYFLRMMSLLPMFV